MLVTQKRGSEVVESVLESEKSAEGDLSSADHFAESATLDARHKVAARDGGSLVKRWEHLKRPDLYPSCRADGQTL
jgi:hypothetical protein